MTTTVYSAKQGQRFSADATLSVVSCPSCHVTFAIPESFQRSARQYNREASPTNYWSICCPFGHKWHYSGLNEEQRLRKRLKLAEDATAHERARRDQAEAEARAQKSAKTRFKNERDRLATRAANGVCPCCNRTFKQLARHMQSQHPEYAA